MSKIFYSTTVFLLSIFLLNSFFFSKAHAKQEKFITIRCDDQLKGLIRLYYDSDLGRHVSNNIESVSDQRQFNRIVEAFNLTFPTYLETRMRDAIAPYSHQISGGTDHEVICRSVEIMRFEFVPPAGLYRSTFRMIPNGETIRLVKIKFYKPTSGRIKGLRVHINDRKFN